MAAKKQRVEQPEPPDEAELVPYTFRIQRGLLAALDARVAEIKKKDPWSTIDRSKLMRELIAKGLQESDGENK